MPFIDFNSGKVVKVWDAISGTIAHSDQASHVVPIWLPFKIMLTSGIGALSALEVTLPLKSGLVGSY